MQGKFCLHSHCSSVQKYNSNSEYWGTYMTSRADLNCQAVLTWVEVTLKQSSAISSSLALVPTTESDYEGLSNSAMCHKIYFHFFQIFGWENRNKVLQRQITQDIKCKRKAATGAWITRDRLFYMSELICFSLFNFTYYSAITLKYTISFIVLRSF